MSTRPWVSVCVRKRLPIWIYHFGCPPFGSFSVTRRQVRITVHSHRRFHSFHSIHSFLVAALLLFLSIFLGPNVNVLFRTAYFSQFCLIWFFPLLFYASCSAVWYSDKVIRATSAFRCVSACVCVRAFLLLFGSWLLLWFSPKRFRTIESKTREEK